MHPLLRAVRPAVLILGLAGCSENATLPGSFGLPYAAGEDPPVVTDAETYTLEAAGDGWLGTIDYTFRNRTGRTISILNCNGGYDVKLQRLQGDEWVTTWSQVLQACLSPPIRLAPGDSVRHALRVYGGGHGSRSYPQFSTPTVDGTYRLIVEGAYWNYDHGGPEWGDPPPAAYRVSNPFRIRTEG